MDRLSATAVLLWLTSPGVLKQPLTVHACTSGTVFADLALRLIISCSCDVGIGGASPNAPFVEFKFS